jgi:replicative DNA helicase
MDRETAKKYIKEQLGAYLKLLGIDPRHNFHCLNPNHNDKTPSMAYKQDKNYCHCFGCQETYDTFSLIGAVEGLNSFPEQFKRACEIFNVSIDNSAEREFRAPMRTGKPVIPVQAQPVEQEKAIDEKTNPDFTEQVERAHRALLANPSALKKVACRGLSEEIIRKYKIGYSEGGYNALIEGVQGIQPSYGKEDYKIVLPYPDDTGRYRYFSLEIWNRAAVDNRTGKPKRKYCKLKTQDGETTITAPIFNERYIQRSQPNEVIFITEGIYDALSIEDAGGKAVALTGLAVQRFLDLCRQYRPKCFFVVCLDNEQKDHTQKTAQGLAASLQDLNIRVAVQAVPDPYKDANEVIQDSREALREYVTAQEENATAEIRREIEEYNNTSASAHLQAFLDHAVANRERRPNKTGFTGLDDLLDGGMYAGLYIVGAISSLGKTTFCLQIADNIAQGGQEVLIFSLEMARYELMAKSLSRYTVLTDLEQYATTRHAKTTRALLTGAMYAQTETEAEKERAVIFGAGKRYEEIAKKIYIHEGVGDIGVTEIRQEVEKHIRLKGKPPVILIDYLQILAPYNDRATDKQNTDKAVLELKRLSRDFNTAVIGISSFNRESYTAPVNMASFKESGAVEYSSDVLIALQYQGMDYQEGEADKARQKRVRALLTENMLAGRNGKGQKIQVKILKNRNGSKGDTELLFYPMFNYFTEYEILTDSEGKTDLVQWEIG